LDYFTKDENFGDNRVVRLKIWDTAGQEQFRSLTKNFFRNSDGAILVYDVNSRSSFEKVQEWMQSVLNNTNDNVKIALVGNKIDLKREVSYEEGKNFADLHKLFFFETSAKENIGIDKMIRTLTSEIIEVKSKIYPDEAFCIEKEKEKYKKYKCNC
jgi:small GTP-binding protein